MWRLDSRECVSTLGPHMTYVTGVAGDRLTGALAAAVGRVIVLYSLPPPDLAATKAGQFSDQAHGISEWSAAEVTHWLGTLGVTEARRYIKEIAKSNEMTYQLLPGLSHSFTQ